MVVIIRISSSSSILVIVVVTAVGNRQTASQPVSQAGRQAGSSLADRKVVGPNWLASAGSAVDGAVERRAVCWFTTRGRIFAPSEPSRAGRRSAERKRGRGITRHDVGSGVMSLSLFLLLCQPRPSTSELELYLEVSPMTRIRSIPAVLGLQP